jgi:hypothetical protein
MNAHLTFTILVNQKAYFKVEDVYGMEFVGLEQQKIIMNVYQMIMVKNVHN